MEIKDFGKIGVLMGGPSSEREISLKSGKAVLSALKESGADAVGIDITTDNRQENIRLLKEYNLSCAFIALHGRFGEDGGIQDILEQVNLPYTGSGVTASRLAMDKIGSLEIFQEQGFFVPKWLSLEKEVFQKNKVYDFDLRWPLVVKPANHGSSIGLSIVEDPKQIPAAIDLAFQYDTRIILQEYIQGRELTVGVLAESALSVIEIIPQHKFFDFDAKYKANLTEYIIPADLPNEITQAVRDVALRAHQALGCFGCSRTDIILSAENHPFILEVNTIPGMTATSLLPKAARRAGLEFNQLCLKLLELAYEKAKV